MSFILRPSPSPLSLNCSQSGIPEELAQLCLSFDDGYRDNYDLAYPVLAVHAAPAIFFVCPDLIEKRRNSAPRAHVMGVYLASHDKYAALYKKLAE